MVVSTMMDVSKVSGEVACSETVVEVSRVDSTLVIDIKPMTTDKRSIEDLHTRDETLETAETLLGLAKEAVPSNSSRPAGDALDLSVHKPKPQPRTVLKEEHLPRKKRRIDDVEVSPSQENLPPTSKVARKDNSNKGETKPESNLVNSFVAKAMKIWYDEDLESNRSKDDPKDLTCKETMPKTDSFVSSYPPGYPRPDDSHTTESSSYPFLKLKAMLRKKYANSLNEFSGDESTTSQPSPPLPLQESSQNDQDCRMSVIEAKNGEKLFRCNICFKAFTFSTNLTRHQRNIHGKPYRRRTKDIVPDKRMDRRDSTGSDISCPSTPDSRQHHFDSLSDQYQHDSSNRSTPLSHLTRPICSQCDQEFDNDEQLELHNCDNANHSLNNSGFSQPMSFIQELTAKIEQVAHPLKSRCEDLMREESRRASFGGLPQHSTPAIDRRLSMETGLVPPRNLPFENETKFQIVLSDERNNPSPSPSVKSFDSHSDSDQVSSPVLGNMHKEETDMWRFKCIECRLAFPSSKHLSKHLKVIHKVSIKEDGCTPESPNLDYRCKECGKTFSQHAYLRRHMRNIHMKTQPIEQPPLEIPSPNSLNVVCNAGNLIIPGMTTIFCHLCGQTFSHPVHHYMHMAMSHGVMLQPDKDPRFLLPSPHFDNTRPAEPKEADTAETRPALGNLPSPLLPSGLIPIVPSFPFVKEKPSAPPVAKEEKRPALLEGRCYSDNGLDLTKSKDRIKDIPRNLGEFILKKVVQEVKTPNNNENLVKDYNRRLFSEDYGKENQENNMFSQNINKNKNSPADMSAEKLMFPSHSDGKRHICGLCGASFTFQTNLTRHQRKLHGKPFVRRPSASQVFKQESNI